MKIEIPKVPENGHWVDEEVPVREMHLEYPYTRFEKPVKAHLFVNVVSGDLLARGELKTSAVLECSRCLKDFAYPIELKKFTFCEPVQGRLIIDLTPAMEEDILLTLPSKPLCSKECRGLCPQCGQNFNEKRCSCKQPAKDIRLKDLDNLKFD